MAELLLLPLRTVLVPGASLGLRVFEAHDLALVSACSRSGDAIGACLQLDGGAVGTEALIEDFGTGGDGVLALRVRGDRRFRTLRARTRGDGLRCGEVEWLPPDGDDALRPEHALLGTVLGRILEKAGGEHARAPSMRFDDAAWVGWRLAELLPLSEAQRQSLLEAPDPHRRLDRLLALMPD